MSGKLDDMLFNPGRPSYTEMERENVNLRQKLVAVTAERDAMLAAITAFCRYQEFAGSAWKAQPQIKPLFDIYEKEMK